MRPVDFAVSVSQGVPQSVRELFWLVFFASRGRGISLDAHFPWLEDEIDVVCLQIADVRPGTHDTPLAALLIRKVDVAKGKCIGLVGLVCVAEEWRGKGLSTKLLSKAADLGREINLSALVLWTQKPDVYVGQGFRVDEQDIFSHVKKNISVYPAEEYSTNSWPDKKALEKKQGLAPFATSGEIIKSQKACLVVFHSAQISTLVDWEGEDVDVISLLHSALPDHWALTSNEDEKLIFLLKEQGFHVEYRSSSVRMIKILDAVTSIKIPQINIMDRI